MSVDQGVYWLPGEENLWNVLDRPPPLGKPALTPSRSGTGRARMDLVSPILLVSKVQFPATFW